MATKRAMACYNGEACAYIVGGQRYERGVSVMVEGAANIEYLSTTKGFSIESLAETGASTDVAGEGDAGLPSVRKAVVR
jgi:hypothetical protein